AGSPVPFGAVASVEGNDAGTGIVGSGGKVYLTGMPDEGHITVRWGAGQQEQCTSEVHVTEQTGPAGLYSANAVCRE
ncbi:hypothetical protein HBZ99_004710, partial [Salmonella enterica subsp. enterica]|nr:hypothetical protein [Salmonella enterica subsp. enterica serovar Oranienburg]EEP8814280.1 hypothetical protein [Salmonella enterica subsp. enterica serovar Oranienburg]